MVNVVWFKEDLRIQDNPGLYHATKQATQGVVGLYIIDATLWKKHQVSNARVDFILRGLKTLQKDLGRLNISLIVKIAENTTEIPVIIFEVLAAAKAKALFYNYQYEVNESRRDQAVVAYLKKQKIACYGYHDQVIFTPGTIVNQHQQYYKVFTAYKKAWLKQLTDMPFAVLPGPKRQSVAILQGSTIPNKLKGFTNHVAADLWPAGESFAQQRLEEFITEKLFDYDKTRDFPALDGTSRLSPYLSAGMLSVRQCFRAALQANQGELYSGNKGVLTWMQELIWRDFYKHILVAVPRVSMNQAYKSEFEHIHWQNNMTHLQAWQQGKTGFPLIDAAIRQLNQTHWMHNRLRMITAMFLCKNLLIDWRLGESYFMQQLIDGDLSANNGGWQWCASTGTDAAPYFRVFNPITQSERFDPKGVFIRQYCPELAHLDDKEIHAPYQRASHKLSHSEYPKPIVDLKASKERAINAFRLAKSYYQPNRH